MTSLAIAEITDAEAESVGVKVGDLNWGDKIAPLLIKKGFPPETVWIGNMNIRSFRHEETKSTQFELLGK